MSKKREYFGQAKSSLRILMARLALSDMYKALMALYTTQMAENFDVVLNKLLYRCLKAWQSINQVQKIFTLIQKKDKFMDNFLQTYKNAKGD